MSITAALALFSVFAIAMVTLIAWIAHYIANDYYEKERIKQLERHMRLWGNNANSAAHDADRAELEQLRRKHSR